MNELTTTFRVESPPAWLEIGYDAENNWRTITINCEYWFNIDSNGVVVLMYKPSCGKAAYPLKVNRSGNNIVWTPESAELLAGVGTMQAFFEVNGETIGASKKIPCEVDGSLLGSASGGTPPWAIDVIEEIKTLTGHYPYVADNVLYVWDSINEEWVEFSSTGGGAVDSVNGQTGAVVLGASDVGALPSSYTPPVVSVNGKTGAVTLGAADVHALPDNTPIPVVPQMATQDDMSDWTSGKTVDAAVLKADVQSAVQSLYALQKAFARLDLEKADKTEIPTKTSDLTNDSGFQTAPFEIPITQSGSTYTTTATAADILANVDNCILVQIGGIAMYPMAYFVQGSNARIVFSGTDSINGFIQNVTFTVTVNNGTVTIGDYQANAQSELPDATSASANDFLCLNAEKQPIWKTVPSYQGGSY